MRDDANNPDALPSPGEMSDEQLDDLLAEARWPKMSAESLERLSQLIAAPVSIHRTSGVGWWIGGLAAAAGLAVAATLWLAWPAGQAQQISADQPGPEEADLPAPEPRFHYAVLPGREATDVERAWAQIIRREAAEREENLEPAPQPQPKQGVPTLTEVVRPAPLGQAAPRLTASRQQSEQLLAILLDRSADPAARQQAANSLPIHVIEQALSSPVLLTRAPELAAALASSNDASAAQALVRLAERDQRLAQAAVAAAPAGSTAVMGLIDCLDDPLIARREKAASLLATSSDPAVAQVLARRLTAPASRREVLIALISSETPAAKALLERAEAHPQLGAIVQSLRLQGYGPARQHSQLQMIIL